MDHSRLSVGIEITGIDLREPIAPEDADDLRSLLAHHQLLVIRDQAIAPDDQIRVLGIFGNVLDETGDGSRYQYVSGYESSVFPGRLLFHSDNHFAAVPLELLSLYAEEVSDEAAPTVFCDNCNGYRRLPQAVAERLDSAQVSTKSFFHLGFSDRASRTLPADLTGGPEATHPAVWKHPETGEPFVYLTELHANHILGLAREESTQLLDEVFAAIYDEANLYEHKWRAGDIVIWDNRAVQHARGEVPPAQSPDAKPRTIRRVSVGSRGFTGQFKFAPEVVEQAKREGTGAFFDEKTWQSWTAN